MQFIKQGKQTRSWWREKRLAEEAELARDNRLGGLAISVIFAIYAVLTLLLQGVAISLPFLVLAAYIYARR